MKIYFAGEGYETVQGTNKANVLISYFYLNYKKKHTDLKKKYGWDKLFVDSGAFTAYTQNVKINILQYVDYIKKGYADYYAVLDVIGDAEKTNKNLKFMEKQGVNPLPCFHYGEDWKWLDVYCGSYDYICLGGMVPISTPELKKWLDVVFYKYPKQKFHGFGLTSTELMKRYSWHSVDSSTWVVHMKFNELNHYKYGRLYLGENKKEFLKIIKDAKNKKWIEAIKGFEINPECLFDDYRQRTNFNLKAFKELEININETKPFKKDFQSTIPIEQFKLPKLPKFERKQEFQYSLKNLNLGYSPRQIHYEEYYESFCVLCNKSFVVPDITQFQKICPYCGDKYVDTAKLKRREVIDKE